jgi:hypothetical protein
MDLNLTEAQLEYVQRYQALYNSLSDIEFQIQDLSQRAAQIMNELETMRTEEEKLFEKE